MDVPAVRRDLLDLTERLVEEYAGIPAGSVIRCVARCKEELLAAGVRSGLVEAVEAMARHRLQARTGPREVRVPAQQAPEGHRSGTGVVPWR